MANVDFISPLHKRTTRDYVGRVNEYPKAAAARVARQFGADYWDGDRRYGYGGYRYDGRWRPVAELLAAHYALQPGDRVVDVGCGKGHLLYELTQVVPGLRAVGYDLSGYALRRTQPALAGGLVAGSAVALPLADQSCALALSINTIHNLPPPQAVAALGELARVARRQYVCVESYRTEEEKVNLLYWQLTCECFASPATWDWLFKLAGYAGDYSYIYFE
ncbi:MAG: class I SAM-dependent methyltransferase [Fimbriimonadaceae bacterium]|nr:class I SAM-dependent methyltransferase [Fimbriimonadaceae bacterium]